LDELYQLRTVVLMQVLITLVGAMGAMALGLSIVGLYGLVSYAVSRRTREIGIRMAMGAGRERVLQMVLRQGLILAVVGLGFGLAAGAGARRALATLFPGGRAGDGVDVVPSMLVAFAILTVTLLAAYVPARRASRVNPTEALRCD
jgi:ABC-type antimicrobial peptide transport system permease subunit